MEADFAPRQLVKLKESAKMGMVKRGLGFGDCQDAWSQVWAQQKKDQSFLMMLCRPSV